MIRCFIAIELDDRTRRDLHAIAAELDSTGWRLAPAEKYHITLKFLGDVAPDELPAICGAIEHAAKQAGRISIRGTQVSVIPNSRRPRVLAAMFEPDDAIKNLVEELEIRLADLGFAMERRGYHPHVTLGRKNRTRPRPRVPFQVVPLDHLSVDTDRIALIQSTLTDRGSIYQIMSRFPLAG